MDGYRLRSAHGDTIDPRQPLPTDSVEAQETIAVSSTFTYNGKAAAGAVSIGSLPLKPVIEGLGSRVASYWGDKSNLVYTAFADRSQNKGSNVFLTVTETATAAAITIYDADKNLEEMFESVSGTVKRFVAKVTDTAGGVLYGWIRGITVSSDVYTFEIMNARLAETQSWVGALGAFTSTSLEKVEIFYYNSSIAFATGTCFTEEVECPKEYSKNRELQLTYAEGLSNGQYFVDYMRGELIGVKADATVSETVTYNVWSSTTGGRSVAVGGVYNASAPTLDDGDVGALQLDVQGNLQVNQYTKLAGEDLVNDIMKTQEQGTYTVPLTASALVKAGAGQLLGFVVNSCNAGATLKIWDNTSAATTVMFDTMTFTLAEAQGPKIFRLPAVKFTTGCYFTISGTISVTPIWN